MPKGNIGTKHLGPERDPSRPKAVDRTPEKPMQNAERTPEKFPAAVRDIVAAVNDINMGDIVFIHDILAKRGAEESAHLAQTTHEAEGYIEDVKTAFEENKDVIVLGWEDLERRIGEGSQNSKTAIKDLARENPDKKIVINFDPLRDKSIAPKWTELEKAIGSNMELKGVDAEEWLKEWAKREPGEHIDGDPTMDEMRAGCAEALSSMGELSVDFDNSMRLGLGGSPLALALVVFATKGSLSYRAAKDLFDRPHRIHQVVTFIEIRGNKLRIYFGEEVFERTL